MSSFVRASLIAHQALPHPHFCVPLIQFELRKKILQTVLHLPKVLQLAERTLQLRVYDTVHAESKRNERVAMRL